MARTMSEEIKKNKSMLFYKIFMYCKMNNIYYDMYIQNISKYTLHLLKEKCIFKVSRNFFPPVKILSFFHHQQILPI